MSADTQERSDSARGVSGCGLPQGLLPPPSGEISTAGDLHTDDDDIPLQIFVPELVLQKCFNFKREELIWNIKQAILSSLPKELKECFNYGLYCPPVNGKSGKFLDEERPISDYPLMDPVAYLELRYKRRVYRMVNVDEKHIKQLHTRANLRRLLDNVGNGNVEKVNKLCTRGLDPNFHDPDSGETPLTLAATLKLPNKMIIALVNGGALVDFRTKDGRTALHRAVERNNLEALKTLLDLGASPNYRDAKGLTSLYYTIIHGADVQLTEMLLHDHAATGAQDPQGWQEVHQACKHGMAKHLDQLLYYGACIDARNASGNTPLHVCAVNDQEDCLKCLLKRGADLVALNYANQTPYQVAVIAGNHKLAEMIQNHKPDNVVPFDEPPSYNLRRRVPSVGAVLSSTVSDSRLCSGAASREISAVPNSSCGRLPSRSPFNRSLPALSSDTLSSHSGGSTFQDELALERPLSEAFRNLERDPVQKHVLSAGSICIAQQNYVAQSRQQLSLHSGDTIEVLHVIDSVMLEGRNRETGQCGLFPSVCVTLADVDSDAQLFPRGRPTKSKLFTEARTVFLHKGKKGFGFILRGAKDRKTFKEINDNGPSLQYLDDIDKGGVADMAGLKKGDYLLEINGQDVSQATHDTVVNIIRQSGDLVAMTVVSAISADDLQANYRQCTTLPSKLSKKAPAPPKRDPKTTLTLGPKSGSGQIDHDVGHGLGLGPGNGLGQLLDYNSSSPTSFGQQPQQIQQQKQQQQKQELLQKYVHQQVYYEDEQMCISTIEDANKLASIRSRPSSRRMTSVELEEFFTRQSQQNFLKHKQYQHKQTPTDDDAMRKCATIARFSRSGEVKPASAEEEEALKALHKNFASVPDLNKEGESSKSRSAGCDNLKQELQQGDIVYSKSSKVVKKDDKRIYAETLPLGKKILPGAGPPPTHPPPPPPGQQTLQSVGSKSEYTKHPDMSPETLSLAGGVHMSSFRPGDSAKLYASPESILSSVGYRSTSSRSGTTPAGHRSQSVPPPRNRKDTSAAYKMQVTAGTGSGNRDNECLPVGDVKTPPLPPPPSESLQLHRSHHPAHHPPYISEPDCNSSDDDIPKQELPLPSPPPLPGQDAGGPQGHIKPPVRSSSIQEQPLPKPPRSQLSVNQLTTSATGVQSKRQSDKIVLEQLVGENNEHQGVPTQSMLRCSTATAGQMQAAALTASGHLSIGQSHDQRPMSHDDSSLIEKKLIEQRRAQVIHQHILAQQQPHMVAAGRSAEVAPTTPVGSTSSEELLKRLNQSYLVQRGQSADDMAAQRSQQLTTLQRQHQQPQQQPQQQHQMNQRRSQTAARVVEANNNISTNNNLSQQQIYLLQQRQLQQQRQATLPFTKHSGQVLTPQQQAALHQQQIYQQHLQRQRELQLHNQGLQCASSQQSHQQQQQSQQTGQQNIPKKTLKIRLDQKVQATRRSQDRCSSLDRNAALQRSLDSTMDCSGLRKSIDESLQFIRMQVDSLGLAAVTEVDVLPEVVPPPPEFTAAQRGQRGGSQCPPPPQFSDHLHHVARTTIPQLTPQQHAQLTPQQQAAYQAALHQQQQRQQLQQQRQQLQQHHPGRASPDLRQQYAQQMAQQQAVYEAYAKRLQQNGCNTLPSGFTGGGTLRVIRQNQGWENQQLDGRQQFGTIGGRMGSHVQHSQQQSRLQQQYQQYQLQKQQQAVHQQQATQPQQGVLQVERHDLAKLRTVQREFRQKSLDQWTQRDVADWLESLFLQEYKTNFQGINGAKLLEMNQNDFIALGVKQVGHRVNMERSLKRYMKQERILHYTISNFVFSEVDKMHAADRSRILVTGTVGLANQLKQSLIYRSARQYIRDFLRRAHWET